LYPSDNQSFEQLRLELSGDFYMIVRGADHELLFEIREPFAAICAEQSTRVQVTEGETQYKGNKQTRKARNSMHVQL
jgi:hypothetical protein